MSILVSQYSSQQEIRWMRTHTYDCMMNVRSYVTFATWVMICYDLVTQIWIWILICYWSWTAVFVAMPQDQGNEVSSD